MRDYQQLAIEAANHCHNQLYSTHRGAVPTAWDGISIIFGNDGERWRGEVDLLRESLAAVGIEEVGYGKNESGDSWAMLVQSEDWEALDCMIWDCWTKMLPDGRQPA